MKNGKKRVRIVCINEKCKREFSILPRTDGKPQRSKCYRCEKKAVSK